MKLSYRGQTYDYSPTVVEGDEVLLGGTYRGNQTTIHVHSVPRHRSKTLTYRGVKFQTR